jgi:crotonobetainyl-CoA:carnitine CoA-transferase CaiB-like acyl-CoA transferase
VASIASGSGSLASGLRVVEIGESIAAATAGWVLSDYGADVCVVEPPGGSRLRQLPAWPMWARGKRAAPLDLTSGAGAAALGELVDGADVAIVALEPATADRLGVDGASLAARRPALVHCEITGFGRGHPLSGVPGYEGAVAVRGGRAAEFSSLFGGARPAFPAVPVGTYGAAMLAVQGIFAALLERERTGQGQRLSTSLLGATSVYDMIMWVPGGDRGVRIADNPMLFYTVARTSDGVWLQFSENSPRLFRAFLRAIELEHLLDEPRYRGAPSFVAPDDGREMRAVLMQRIGQKTWAEWQAIFAPDPDVNAEQFALPGEALHHPQLLANGDSREVDGTRWLGPLVDCSATPALAHRPAPRRGAELPLAWAGPRVEPTRAGGGHRLLEGVTVLELSTWIATPTAAGLLADLGARVIKIEPPEGDPLRQHANAAMKTVQGKECIIVDLKSPDARPVMHRLVEHADVLIHNYRPGAPERLGIDYASLRAVNPRLVYLYAGSYGSTGPYAPRPAFHVTAGAVCGGARAQAGAGNPPPPGAALTLDDLVHWSRYLTRSNEANPDYNGGLASAAAVTMALWARERTGEGQALETRMMRSNAYTLSEHYIDYAGRPPRSLPDHDLYGLRALYRLYEAAEGWVFMAVAGDRDFGRLCAVLGRPGLATDASFATAEARAANDAALASELAAAVATRTAAEWEADAVAAGLALVESNAGVHASYILDSPWAEELGFVETTTATGAGPYRRYGRGVRTEHPLAQTTGAGEAGTATRRVLVSVGYDDEEIDKLLASGVVSAAATGTS